MQFAGRMIPPFNDKLEGHLLFEEWNKWHQAFERVCVAMKLKDEEEKYNWLMAIAGQFICDIHDNTTKVAEEVAPDEDGIAPLYSNAIKRLKAYFDSKSNVILQKEIFREMKQKSDEDFTSFLIRLRQQVTRCGYDVATQADEIHFQIVQGAKSGKVRQKARQVKNIDELSKFATGQEADELKLKKKAETEQENINAVKVFKSRPKSSPKWSPKFSPGEKRKCFRCEATDHLAAAESCPARGHKCASCGKLGHYEKCCNSRKRAHDSGKWKGEPLKKRSLNNILEDLDDSNDEV